MEIKRDIRRIEDINSDELNLKIQYYNKFTSGNINDAKKFLRDNPSLHNKVITSDNLNKIVEHILALQSEYMINTKNYLLTLKDNFQLNIDNLIYLKEYDNQKAYKVGNFVTYEDSMRLCIKDAPIGADPINNTSNWLSLGLKGYESYKGLGISYKGAYSSNLKYNKYDMVTYKNNLYIAKTNTSQTPVEGVYWHLGMKVENQGILVLHTEPDSIQEGGIWFEIE